MVYYFAQLLRSRELCGVVLYLAVTTRLVTGHSEFDHCKDVQSKVTFKEL